MKMRFDFPSPQVPRGGAPVGQLCELDALEQAAVLCLRGWCDDETRAAIADSFRLTLGHTAGADALANLDGLMQVTTRGARRPLMCHDMACRCIGGDESAFAQMLAAAATQDTDEATLFACTLLRGPAAFEAVRLAQTLGPTLLRLARGDQPAPHAYTH